MAVDDRRKATVRYKLIKACDAARQATQKATGRESIMRTLYIDQRTYLKLLREVVAGQAAHNRYSVTDLESLERGEWYGAQLLIVNGPNGSIGEHIVAVAEPLAGTRNLGGLHIAG